MAQLTTAELELRIISALLLPMLASAVLFTGMTVALLVARARLYGYRVYRPMLLNLALAWIPIISVAAALLYFLGVVETSRWAPLALLVIWCLFFPNSTYLITEFHHLKDDVTRVPFWFDTITILSLALCGALLGAFSLLLAQHVLELYMPWPLTWALIVGYLFVSNLGIYIGRFLRFNSWDVVTNPVRLIRQVWAELARPETRRGMLLFASVFTAFLASFYLFVCSAIEPAAMLLRVAILQQIGQPLP
ncbi:MAG TPA: DUF1361 domain-containing protein [Ktedonobacterales bacterium]|jgi:uncharacterized membrane protein|nr:DUF1361 domain-containing protein [Ktedonobacterales bacterium]